MSVPHTTTGRGLLFNRLASAATESRGRSVLWSSGGPPAATMAAIERAIEAADSLSLDEYLQRYFSNC